MKSILKISALALLLAIQPASWAINKCTAADGTVAFQDGPCQAKGGTIQVRPAAGQNAPATNSSSSAKPQTEAQRLEALITESQRTRRLRDLQDIYYPSAKGAVLDHRQSCAQEQKDLEASKARYVQNLYGKVNSAQMASEMAAAATRCDQKDRELVANEAALKAECTKLGGCK
jgi:hypothetical protein